MKRRRLIAIISVCTLAGIALLLAIGGVVVMKTDIARNFVQGLLASALNGSVHVGRISGNPLAGITIDTLAIRDTTGALVLSTGRVKVDYDIRDLMDTRIYLRHVVADHPHLHLRDYGHGKWNYQLLKSKSGGKRGAGRSWGSFVVVDSLKVNNASFLLEMPWTPDDTLQGAVREAVIRRELARKDRLIQRRSTGLTRTYMWTYVNALITHARIADPDSNQYGQEFHIASLNANEFDPPFRFRNVRGVVRRLGDSVWFDVPHWDLPGSRGSAKGKLVWGSNLPMRYDLTVRGDTVSLVDVNWVYPTLPKTGGGKMLLRISNKRNVRVMDYHIDSMNVRTTGSHLVGEMTFGVGGGGLLQVRNVNLRANPVDFEFIKALNGKPFPIDWRGQIFGDVRAPGGPVNNFTVASARAEWRDTHVPGAVSRMTGSGGLDIQFPAFTAFHDFDVDVQTLDLRSIENLFPAFPKLKGTIAGSATLDSVWTDVRFSNADVTHRDGPGTPSRFTGQGRVTDGSPFITYDLDLVADPLSFDMLARSFPGITLRGLAYGEMKIKGQSPDLQIVTNLVSAGGALRFAGNIDIDSLGGYGARGVGEITKVDLSKLGMRPNAPATSLSGRYTVDVRGSTPSSLTGTADLRLGRSTYERIALDSTSRATLRFDQGRVFTNDTLVIESPFGRVSAFGALGLPGGGIDSVNVTLRVDSLGQLRPYFAADGRPTAPADSLGGTILVNGIARGSFDSLFVSGRLSSDTLFVRGLAADSIRGVFSFSDVLRAPSGMLNATLFKTRIGGLEFDTVATAVNVLDTTRATFAVTGKALRGDSLSLASAGGWTRLAGATTVRVDSFALGFGEALWRLEQPATLFTDATTLRIDSVGLRSARGATLGLAGVAPVSGPIDLRLSASRVPLFDLDRVVGQVQAPVSGLADFMGRVTGTRNAPVIDATTKLDSILLSGVRVGQLVGSARYANDRAGISADIFQENKRVLHAVADSLPLAIRWLTYDTLPGRVRANAVADGADFTLIQAAVDMVSNVTGKVFGNASLDGSWRRPIIFGDASLVDGGMRIDTLGIALSKMFGHLSFRNDTLLVDSLSAQSGGTANTAALHGRIAFKDWLPSWFNLAMDMRNVQAYNRPELATIYARTNPGDSVRLWGVAERDPGTGQMVVRDSLFGDVFVDQGAIYLPDPKLVGKRFSALDSAGFVLGSRKKTLYDFITENLYTDLTAHIGGSFKLSADYADIPLSGDLRIMPVAITDVASQSSDFISRLAPVGTINANGGTYDLMFPPIFRKRFDVQRGGTITFDRDAQWNGVLNVSARYVVRKPQRPEVPIVIDVTDRLLSPRVKPRHEASFPISDSDLISYIAFDEPGFFDPREPTAANGGQTLLSSLFTPIATSAAAEYLRQKAFNNWIDQLRFESTDLQTADGQGNAAYNRTLRLTGGKEFMDGRLAVSVSTGFCGLGRQSERYQSVSSIGQQVGGNMDWRLSSSLRTGASLQLSSEPSTQALLCSPGYTGNKGIAPTPRQYSLSLPIFWRW